MHVKAVSIWQQCNQVPTHPKPPAYLPVIYLNITGLPAPTKISVSVSHYLTFAHLHYLSRVPLTIPPLPWNVMCITKKCITCLSAMQPLCYGICECNRLVQLKPIWALHWAKQQKAFMALY